MSWLFYIFASISKLFSIMGFFAQDGSFTVIQISVYFSAGFSHL